MKSQWHKHLLAGAVLVAGCAIVLSGCMGLGGGSAVTPSTLQQARVATTAGSTATSVADVGQQPIIVSPADEYSSFQSKDPFVQQQVPTTEKTPTSSATTAPTSTTTTTTPSTSTTTTSSTSTTTSSSTTSTTSFYTHMLQVLAVGNDAGGIPAVTFQVDNNVYVDQHVGDPPVSTSWGDVTVVGIDTAAKTATLLHDGQTLTFSETHGMTDRGRF